MMQNPDLHAKSQPEVAHWVWVPVKVQLRGRLVMVGEVVAGGKSTDSQPESGDRAIPVTVGVA